MNPHVYLLAFIISQGNSRNVEVQSFQHTSTGVSSWASRSFCKHTEGIIRRRCHPRACSSNLRARHGRTGTARKGNCMAMKRSGEIKSAKSTRENPGDAALAVQHATTAELLGVTHHLRDVLRPGHISQALLRIAKSLVQQGKTREREELLKDPHLHELFMIASRPSSSATARDEAKTYSDHVDPAEDSRLVGTREGTARGINPELSPSQAADVLWACGLLQWIGDYTRLMHLVNVVAEAASSVPGVDGWHITNAVWALDRLGLDRNPATAAPESSMRWTATPPLMFRGSGDAVGNAAVESLRRKAAQLPFSAIPSLFEGLRVQDFLDEVEFGRDEIMLGGGKVLSESRLTAWQSSGDLAFAYSGKVMRPSPFTPNVLRLRDALYERTGMLYDGVLINLYETGSSAMRYHSDPDVGTVWTQDTSVVSVGDTRQFILREIHDHSRRHSFYLSSGDCVRMMGTCQRDYQHCVKASKDDVGPRISLVFKQSIAGQRRNISPR